MILQHHIAFSRYQTRCQVQKLTAEYYLFMIHIIPTIVWGVIKLINSSPEEHKQLLSIGEVGMTNIRGFNH
jgi:hypothetical protein